MPGRRASSRKEQPRLSMLSLVITFGLVTFGATLAALAMYRMQGEPHMVMLVPYLMSGIAYEPVHRFVCRFVP